MSSLLLAGIAWDRLLLLFCPQRRTNVFAWAFASLALALSVLAASPYGYSYRNGIKTSASSCKIKNIIIQCVNPGSTITWAPFFLGARNLSGANQGGPRMATSPFYGQSQPWDFPASYASVASLWLVRLNCAFWPLWNPTERTQTLTRCPYLPVSRVLISAIYLNFNILCIGSEMRMKIQKA